MHFSLFPSPTFFSRPACEHIIFKRLALLRLSLSLPPLSLSLSHSLSLSISLPFLATASRCPLERVLSHVDGESQDGGGLVVQEGVDGHHFQVQDVLLGPSHRLGQDKHGADVVDLLREGYDRHGDLKQVQLLTPAKRQKGQLTCVRP